MTKQKRRGRVRTQTNVDERIYSERFLNKKYLEYKQQEMFEDEDTGWATYVCAIYFLNDFLRSDGNLTNFWHCRDDLETLFHQIPPQKKVPALSYSKSSTPTAVSPAKRPPSVQKNLILFFCYVRSICPSKWTNKKKDS